VVDHLIHSPNAGIIAWLNEFVDARAREGCAWSRSVAASARSRSDSPGTAFVRENMAVTDFRPKHLAMRRLHLAATSGKIRVFPLDARNMDAKSNLNIAVISSWENSILPVRSGDGRVPQTGSQTAAFR